MSKMREAMISQPDELARLLADEAAANRLAGRRVRLIGIGTSWHAAHHGAWMLREAGIEAEALHAADIAPYGRAIDPADGVIVLSHTGGTGYSMTMLERAREAGAETLYISGIGNGGDIETVAAEQWLRANLAAHDARCTLAAWHHPLVSSGIEPVNAAIAPLWQALADNGVDVARAGHDHAYERSVASTPSALATANAGSANSWSGRAARVFAERPGLRRTPRSAATTATASSSSGLAPVTTPGSSSMR